jgi:pyruvate dehydrogenase E1 component alpha subunit
VSEAGLLEAAEFDEVDAEAKDLIERSVAKAKAASYPKPEALLTDVYKSY